MKFLKTKTLSKFSSNDRAVIVYPNDVGTGNRVVFNATGSVMLPKGTTSNRPKTTGVRQPTDANGSLRYNTSAAVSNPAGEVVRYFPENDTGLEVYQSGSWTQIRTQGPARVIQEILGAGTYNIITQPNSDIIRWFPSDGNPLPYVPGLAQGYDPQDYVNNMIVLVENVFQIANTNYELVQSAGQVVGVEVVSPGTGYTPNSTVPITVAAPSGGGTTATGTATTDSSGNIESISITSGGTNYTTIPSVSIAGGAGGTYLAYIAKAGWFIRFYTAVPDTKPVTVLYGFDQ